MAKKQVKKKQSSRKPETTKTVKKEEIKHQRLISLFRKISALIIPVIIVTLLSANVASLFNSPTKFEQAKNTLSNNPTNIEAHLALANELLNNNQNLEAKRELEITDKLLKTKGYSSRVLGIDSQYQTLLTQFKESDPKEINDLIGTWEKVVLNNPGYRDGYLRLAVYYFKIGNSLRANQNIDKAYDLDPNNQTVLDIRKTIQGE